MPIYTSILTRIGEVLAFVRTGGLTAVLVLQRFVRQIFPISQKTQLQPEYQGSNLSIQQNLLLYFSNFYN